MDYTLLTEELFNGLREGEGITARQLTLSCRKDKKIYIFRDNDSMCCCAMEVDNTISLLPQINGIAITYETLAKKGNEMRPFIQLKCSFNIYLHHFAEIVKEIISDYDSGNDLIGTSVSKTINKWKYFFSSPKLGILNEDEIIGLLGELVILERLIAVSPEASIGFWTPERGEEDFVFSNIIIESKATKKDRHEHIINGIDQLKPSAEKKKYICSQLFSPSTLADAANLPDLIEAIILNLDRHPEASDLFLHKLRHRGYDIRDSENYTSFRYNIIKAALFPVDENFPKLTTDELCGPLNARISRIRYTVDIEGISSIEFSKVNFALFI